MVDDPTELDRLRVVLLRLARRIRSTAFTVLTSSQMSTLVVVNQCGPISVSEIAEHEHVQPPSSSKVVSALEIKGLLERTTSTDDRRIQLIDITPRGRALIDEVRAAGRGWIAERLTQLDTTDVDAIAAALPHLERLLGDGDTPRPRGGPR